MSTGNSEPKTLLEAARYFADLDVCHAYMAKLKWPDGVVRCPKCGGEHIGQIASRRMFQCKNKECRKQFSVKVGTIFEDSPLGLDKWFVAVWCITNAKNGISSCELARAIGVTQKSAWHMLHRVRLAMQTETFDKMTGEVEADETYVGGLSRNMHKRKRAKITGTGGAGKAIVHGLLQRGGRVRTTVVKDTKAITLMPIIRSHVQPGTHLYTDALLTYKHAHLEYVHAMVDHAKAYVEGRVHTNGLENFWSLFKRTIGGTYVSVDAQHLGRYADEQVFRYNERKATDAVRFALAMSGVPGKRLTYKALIGDDETSEGHTGPAGLGGGLPN